MDMTINQTRHDDHSRRIENPICGGVFLFHPLSFADSHNLVAFNGDGSIIDYAPLRIHRHNDSVLNEKVDQDSTSKTPSKNIIFS